MILEYCSQGDLRLLLNKKKRLSENEAVEILKAVVTGFFLITIF